MNINELDFKEFTEYVKKIRYGFVDTDKNLHLDEFTNPVENYYLQNPEEVIKNNIGLCFDIVEVYRKYLQEKESQTIFLTN